MMDHMVIAVVNTKFSLSIKSWIKSHGTAALTQAVTCEPFATPTVNFSVLRLNNLRSNLILWLL